MVAKQPTAETDRKRTQGRETAPDTQETVSAADTAHQKISERAYRLYLDRGAEDGHALEDWLRAEREVLGEETRRSRSTSWPWASIPSASIPTPS